MIKIIEALRKDITTNISMLIDLQDRNSELLDHIKELTMRHDKIKGNQDRLLLELEPLLYGVLDKV